MPRKIVLDETRKDRLLEALRLGATLRMAAAACGVSEDTLARWRQHHPELQAEIETAESIAALDALNTIRLAAQGGTWQAAAWLLERRYPKEYGRLARTEEIPTKPRTDSLLDQWANAWR